MGVIFPALPSLVLVFYILRNVETTSQNVATIIKDILLAAKIFLAIAEEINQIIKSVSAIIQLLKK